MNCKKHNVVYLARSSRARDRLLEKTFREHEAALRQFLRLRLIAQQDREDILQELFLRLARVDNLAERLSVHSGNTRSYLFSIVSNLIVDSRRKATSRKQELHSSYDDDLSLTELPTPEMVVATQQQIHAMAVLLRRMPSKFRRAFILNRFKHKSYPEVAKEMGVSVATVQRYIAAALRRLREGMTP